MFTIMPLFVDVFTKLLIRFSSRLSEGKWKSLSLINYSHKISENKYLNCGGQRMRDDEREETYSVRIINSYLEFLPAKSADERRRCK